MKLHLYQNPEDKLSGYINIRLDNLDENENRDIVLDEIADDAEVTKLVANNILEFIPLPELTGFLEHMIQKLRHGGTLIITGVDAYVVAKDYTAYKLSIEDFNILIHGNQQNDNNIKVATLTMHGMVMYLRNEFGLSITRQCLDEYNYVIEAKRP